MNTRRGSRHVAVIGVAASLVLAACGSDTDQLGAGTDPAADAAADGATSTSTPATADTSEDTAAPQTTESLDAPETTAVLAPTEIEVEHYSGTTVVPVDPATVVVMDPAMLLSLDALGVTVDAWAPLGAGLPDEYADAAAGLATVGTPFEPDYEAINALQPDLIIVAGRSSASYPEMEKIAPTVDLTFADDLDTLAAFRQRHETLGAIFGIEDRVADVLDGIDDEIERVAARIEAAEAGRALILMSNGNEISAYGPGSRFGLVHDVFGYAAADDALERDATHGDVVSFEYVRDAAPDVLFVLDRSAAIGEEGLLAEQVLDNELVASTPAWQNDRVVYVDGFAWYIAANSIPAMHTIIADVEASLP